MLSSRNLVLLSVFLSSRNLVPLSEHASLEALNIRDPGNIILISLNQYFSWIPDNKST